jgi:hypothetical protein
MQRLTGIEAESLAGAHVEYLEVRREGEIETALRQAISLVVRKSRVRKEIELSGETFHAFRVFRGEEE